MAFRSSRMTAIAFSKLRISATKNFGRRLLARKKRYSEARALYLSSLSLKEKLLGRQHPLVASSLTNLATLCRANGDYEEARAYCQKGLHIRKQALGPNHPDLADS